MKLPSDPPDPAESGVVGRTVTEPVQLTGVAPALRELERRLDSGRERGSVLAVGWLPAG
ncbi:MAG: hypothetical protein MI919_02505 [Holophagales bacterium]|nr:hypothetical protein [Holophagales bacterium]